VTDYADANRANWESFNKATSEKPSISATQLKLAGDVARTTSEITRAKIRNMGREFPGCVELRLNRQSLLYTLWVRDPDDANGLGHLGVHYYGQKAIWPAFRVSRKTGGNHLSVLKDQFERVWAMSVPDYEKD
jgi:hypothetical protein